MKQKLLTIVSPRTAWLVLAACLAFWVVSAAGLLEAPLGTPPGLMFLWLYCNLITALATTLAAATALAALVLRRAGKGLARKPGDGPAAEQEPGRPEGDETQTADPDGSATTLGELLAKRR